MKITISKIEFTHDDLVNLFSTATYCSYIFGLNYNGKEYKELPNADDNDCIEDKLAKLLLAGKSVEICDYYAEDDEDFYGKLPNKYDYECGSMDYTITLKDVEKGIKKAFANGGWDARCALNLINDDAYDLDLPQAENLMQIIVFGEAIYG